MDKERDLYNIFVDLLIEKVQSGEPTPKEMEIVMNFLKNNNIQATTKHSGLNKLTEEVLDLPFDDSERPLKRIK